mmetsp:Transcript_24238/g.43814  ORF Transcript_24238/g.43814 Transcript_24238/m.43814 type:complete len:204 (+) Transcript_24238:22-633(+)
MVHQYLFEPPYPYCAPIGHFLWVFPLRVHMISSSCVMHREPIEEVRTKKSIHDPFDPLDVISNWMRLVIIGFDWNMTRGRQSSYVESSAWWRTHQASKWELPRENWVLVSIQNTAKTRHSNVSVARIRRVKRKNCYLPPPYTNQDGGQERHRCNVWCNHTGRGSRRETLQRKPKYHGMQIYKWYVALPFQMIWNQCLCRSISE